MCSFISSIRRSCLIWFGIRRWLEWKFYSILFFRNDLWLIWSFINEWVRWMKDIWQSHRIFPLSLPNENDRQTPTITRNTFIFAVALFAIHLHIINLHRNSLSATPLIVYSEAASTLAPSQSQRIHLYNVLCREIIISTDKRSISCSQNASCSLSLKMRRKVSANSSWKI